MKSLACISKVGGVGRSTLVAQLGAILQAKQSKPVLLVDLDAQNTLALHLGLNPDIEDGWWCRLSAGDDPLAAAFEANNGVKLLPFGRVAPCELEASPDMVRSGIATLCEQLKSTFNGWILFDTPRQDCSWTLAIVEKVDVALNVVRADAQSLACMARGFPDDIAAQQLWLINQFEPAQPLQADLFVVWQDLLGERLMTEVVHRDRAVGEAFAANLPLAEWAPQAQATHDFHGVAQRLLHLLSQ